MHCLTCDEQTRISGFQELEVHFFLPENLEKVEQENMYRGWK